MNWVTRVLLEPHALLGLTSAQFTAGVNGLWIAGNLTIAYWLFDVSKRASALERAERQVLRWLALGLVVIATHRVFWNFALWLGDGHRYAEWAYDYRAVTWVPVVGAGLCVARAFTLLRRSQARCRPCAFGAIVTAALTVGSVWLTPDAP